MGVSSSRRCLMRFQSDDAAASLMRLLRKYFERVLSEVERETQVPRSTRFERDIAAFQRDRLIRELYQRV